MAKVNAIKPENLERQLAGVRNGDAALTKDLLVSGVVSLGRPLFDHEHKVNAAITVTIPAIRYKPQHLRNIEQQLTLAAGPDFGATRISPSGDAAPHSPVMRRRH